MFRPEIFRDIFEAYEKNRYCDLEICGQLPKFNKQMKPISCHKLVLCSFIPRWKDLITEDIDHIVLPDFAHEDLLRFCNTIYESLIPGKSHLLKDLDANILEFLGVKRPLFNADVDPEPSDKNEEVIETDPLDLDDVIMDDVDAPSLFLNLSDEQHDPHDTLSPFNSMPDAPAQIQQQESQPVIGKIKRKARKAQNHGEFLPNVNASQSQHKHLMPRQAKLLINHEMMQSPVQTQSIDLAMVRKLLTGECQGPLNVDLTTLNVEAKCRLDSFENFTKQKDAFFALIGVQKVETEWVGQPLAWTSNDPTIIKSNLDTTIQAFQTVFGLPRAPLLGACAFLSTKGYGRWYVKGQARPETIARKYTYQYNRQDLENELKKKEMMDGFAATPPTRKDIDLPLRSYVIRMTEKLAAIDDVVLVGAYPHGVEIRQITLKKKIVFTPEEMLSRILTMVWVGGSNEVKFEAPANVKEMSKLNNRLTFAKNAIDRLLASDQVLPKPLPVNKCDICGKCVKENSSMNNMRQHLENHKIQQFQCECLITFKSFADKKRHYDEVHCLKPPKKKRIPKKKYGPYKKQPEEFVCDTCGQVFKNFPYFKFHVQSRHGNFQCELCGQTFEKDIDFQRHCEKEHPQLGEKLGKDKFPCPNLDCDLSFLRKTSLVWHIKTAHAPKLYKCGVCKKTFANRYHLKYHVLNMHIKSRPFVCRSEGCTADFNFSGTMYAHEKNLHGKSFGKATPIDDVITNQKLLDLGCEFKLGKPTRNTNGNAK